MARIRLFASTIAATPSLPAPPALARRWRRYRQRHGRAPDLGWSRQSLRHLPVSNRHPDLMAVAGQRFEDFAAAVGQDGHLPDGTTLPVDAGIDPRGLAGWRGRCADDRSTSSSWHPATPTCAKGWTDWRCQGLFAIQDFANRHMSWLPGVFLGSRSCKC